MIDVSAETISNPNRKKIPIGIIKIDLKYFSDFITSKAITINLIHDTGIFFLRQKVTEDFLIRKRMK